MIFKIQKVGFIVAGIYLILTFPTISLAKAKQSSDKLQVSCYKEGNFSDCEKVNKFCSGGDAAACKAMALYWYEKQGDPEVGLSFVKLACKNGDTNACESYATLLSQNSESKRIAERRQELEAQRDAMIEARAEADRQQRNQGITNGLRMMSGFMNQPAPQQQRPVRCRTVERPGNQYVGTTYTTVCD